MTSGATDKDAPSAMGFNECEQIADMMEIAENQRLSEHMCFVGAITFHMEVFCIVIASFQMMDTISNKLRRIYANQEMDYHSGGVWESWVLRCIL